jgi:hypothetical protein
MQHEQAVLKTPKFQLRGCSQTRSASFKASSCFCGRASASFEVSLVVARICGRPMHGSQQASACFCAPTLAGSRTGATRGPSAAAFKRTHFEAA